MMNFVRGDLLQSSAGTLVNPVNCRGTMGKGLALQFRERWPAMYCAYRAACRHGEVRIGRPFLYQAADRKILCFPTKEDWRLPSQYEFIEAGLEAIRERYREWGIDSLAMPAVGCGLGGLDWTQVRPLIMKYLGDLPIVIEVYEPVVAAVEDGR